MIRFGLAIALVSCASSSSTKPPVTPPPTVVAPSTTAPIPVAEPVKIAPEPAPKVSFVVSEGKTLRFVETGPDGVKVTRTLEAPGDIIAMRWVNAEPVVLLDGGDLGRITATGYTAVPKLPPKTWSMKKPKGYDHFDTPVWGVVETDKELWQGRCEWGYFGDGDECTEWIWARVSPGPVITSKEMPKSPELYSLPEILPSKTTKLALVDYTPEARDESDKPKPYKILRCTVGGKTVEWPTAEERDGFWGVTSVTWMRSEPPLFTITGLFDGLDVHEVDTIFEGCAVNEAMAGADVTPGPQSIITIRTYEPNQISVRFKGREIGTVPDVGIVRFAPKQ